MKLRKKFAVLIALLLVLTAAAGCGSSGGNGGGGGKQSDSEHYPVTISIYNYAKEPIEVTFESCPQRV
ncbi:MAG: iron ABC transporter substrate-binding protein, partial [Eubacteriaceae bacterium]|nr:iron ABC transporter substrate-binding protein [Eubacteriaceae bacterium]